MAETKAADTLPACRRAPCAWQGNPVCREVEYRFTVLAYIKNITYHDYGTVDPAEVLQVHACNTDKVKSSLLPSCCYYTL